jgi:hypothetical protein
MCSCDAVLVSASAAGRTVFLNLIGQREASLCSVEKDLLTIWICEFVRRSATGSGI